MKESQGGPPRKYYQLTTLGKVKKEETVKITVELEDKTPTGVAGLGVKDTSGNTLKNYGIIVRPVAIKDIEITATAKSEKKMVVEFKNGDGKTLALDPDLTKEKAFSTDITQDDVTISGNKVTIDLAKDLNADPNDNSLTINGDLVYLYDGTTLSTHVEAAKLKFGGSYEPIGDEISPSLVSNLTKQEQPGIDGTDVAIKLVFDEKLNVKNVSRWETALTVIAVDVEDNQEPSFIVKPAPTGTESSDTITVLVPISELKGKDTAFDVGVKENARFITDASKNLNLANETDPLVRTKSTTGIAEDGAAQKAVNDEAAKITADKVNVLGATVDTTAAGVSTGYTVTIKSSSEPAVIATNGTITRAANQTPVDLVFTVTNDTTHKTADTQTITVTVPAQ